MGYIIIELPIEKGEIYSVANFDKKKFEQQHGVTLKGDPLKFEKDEKKITLTFEGEAQPRKSGMPISYPI